MEIKDRNHHLANKPFKVIHTGDNTMNYPIGLYIGANMPYIHNIANAIKI